MKKELKIGYICIIITTMIWGIDNVLFKDILNYISPNILSFIRFATVIIVNSLILIITRTKTEKSLINKEYKKNIIFMGIFMLIGYFFVFNGLSISKATLVEFINSGLGSIITIIILAIFIDKEKNIAKNKYVISALIIAVIGTFFTSNINNSLFNFNFDLGVLYVLIGTTAFAIYTMLISKSNHKISVFRINRDFTIVAFILISIICAFTNEFKLLFQIDKFILLKIILISIFVDVIAIACYYKAIRIISGVKSNIFILSCPIITAFVSYFYLKETINNLQLIGCSLLFISGIIIFTKDYIDEKNVANIE
ncbi:MAG: DMT family transporter [Clostridia bacterium]|nr:DMT family transporter [Clostridia bacterium]